MWAITQEERGKHDKQFDSLVPVLGYVSGEQARKFFLQSGLPASVLAEIWNLADLEMDGKMDHLEFSIAMKLIKLKLQGHGLPSSLPVVMIQPPLPNPMSLMTSSTSSGLDSKTIFSTEMPAVPSLTPVGANAPAVTQVPALVPTPVTQPLKPALGAPAITLSSFSSSMVFSPSIGMSTANSLLDLESSSSNSSSSISLASTSPKTGTSDWAVPQASRLKYRQQFNGLDKLMSGYLSGPQVRNALTASNLTQTQLANIWTLADVDKDGQLRAEEFILAMHLVDMAKTGCPLPLTLPTDLVPPSLRKLRPGELINGTGPYVAPSLVEGTEVEPTQKTKSYASFEERLKEHYVRGSVELEKRRLALEEERRKERERREREAWEAQERREWEAWERENQRRKEERTVEEKQREEERQREMEKREATKKELDRRQREEWERGKMEELGRKREGEQGEITRLRAKKRSLEMELEAMGSKHRQMAGHFRDAQSKRRIRRAELDLINQKRERRIAEINTLQSQFEEYQRKLSRLIPEQKILTERLRNSGLKKLPSLTLTARTTSVEEKGLSYRRLKDQLDTLERETTDKLAQMDQYNNEVKFGDMDDCYLKGLLSLLGCLSQLFLLIKELREKQARQQAILEDLCRVKEQKLRTIEKQKEEERNRREGEEAARQAKLNLERIEEEQREEEKALQRRLQEEEKEHQRRLQEEEKEHQRRLQEEEKEHQRRLQEEVDGLARVQDPSEMKEEKRREKEEVCKMKEHPQKDVQHAVLMPPTSAKLTPYKALYPFTARNADELSVKANGLIEERQITHITDPFSSKHTIETVDEKAVGEQGWLFGNYLGNCGWFPQSYAQKHPSGDSIGAHPTSVPAPLPPSLHPHALGVQEEDTNVGLNSTSSLCPTHSEPTQCPASVVARALSSWSGSADHHLPLPVEEGPTTLLSFCQDDVITVLEQREDWCLGELNGMQGWFPNNCVTLDTSSCAEPIYSSVDELDSNSGQLQEFVALYPYESPQAGDLTFAEGDVIMVLECEGEWWRGCIGDRRGVFPSNYVKAGEQEITRSGGLTKKPEIAQAVVASFAQTLEQLSLSPGQLIVVFAKNSSGWWLGELQVRGKKRQRGWFRSTNVKLLGPSSGRSTPIPTPVCQVVAMYDYMAANQDEITFSKGQLINVLDKTNPDWWKGEVNGVTGLVPTNYIKMTTDSDPSQL
ncbi:intersectin-2-like [Aplochiton taeniatus]